MEHECAIMTDGKLDELFNIAKLSKPYVFANISASSITPWPWVLLLPTVQSLTDELLAWAGLVPMQEGNGEVCMEGNPCQWLPPLQPLVINIYIKNFIVIGCFYEISNAKIFQFMVQRLAQFLCMGSVYVTSVVSFSVTFTKQGTDCTEYRITGNFCRAKFSWIHQITHFHR